LAESQQGKAGLLVAILIDGLQTESETTLSSRSSLALFSAQEVSSWRLNVLLVCVVSICAHVETYIVVVCAALAF
jgi:hypothetical protein